MADILSRILATKRTEIETLRERRGFLAALAARRPAIIAEIKRKSPSKGRLAGENFDPVAQARRYAETGVAAISVLTDREYFGGSLDDLRQVRSAVRVPVLRKDFLIDEIQVAEAAVAGADAILLIAAALDTSRLRTLRILAESFGMDVLVEAHDREELHHAIDSGASIIGINNRSLRTFEESLDTSLSLADEIPSGVLKVSESAIRSRSDIETLMAAGFQAFLIGEQFMRQPETLAGIAS